MGRSRKARIFCPSHKMLIKSWLPRQIALWHILCILMRRDSRTSPINLTMYLRPVFVFVIGAALLSAAAESEKTPTLDELVAKNIEAKGGIQALRALQSLKLTGKVLVNEGKVQFAYTETKKQPGRIRSEATLQGLTEIEASDGKEGWKISPFQGRKDPERMSADDVKPLIEQAEIDGPLVDWKEKGSTLEYVGREDVDGTSAYKIKVVRKNGDVESVFLDPDHFLEIRTLTQRVRHGAQEEVEKDIGDYEKIAGVFIPFSIEEGNKGDPDKQKTVIERAEANVQVDDAIFKFPTPK
jgi:hypothetical protein